MNRTDSSGKIEHSGELGASLRHLVAGAIIELWQTRPRTRNRDDPDDDD